MCWHWHWHSFHQRHTYCGQLFPIITNSLWCNNTIQQSVACRGLQIQTVLYVCLLERIGYIHTKDRRSVDTGLCDSICNRSDRCLTAVGPLLLCLSSRNFQFSLVRTVTGLQAGLSGVRIPVEARDFCLLQNVKTHPFEWVAGSPSLEVNRQGREADHSPLSSAKVNNEWSYTSTPVYLHGVDRDRSFLRDG
jgi:hypothetical protein